MEALQLPSTLSSPSLSTLGAAKSNVRRVEHPLVGRIRSSSQASTSWKPETTQLLVPNTRLGRRFGKTTRTVRAEAAAATQPAAVKAPGRPGKVTENREIARGTRELSFRPTDGEKVEYEPGHVLSFWIKGSNDKWARHPYTVTECNHDDGTISFCYRVISDGKVTPLLSSLQAGTEVRFEGYYHVPILRGLAEGYSAVVGVATGSGIGALYGFAQQALSEGIQKPFVFIAGYRQEEDIAYRAELDALSQKHPNFSWVATLSEPDGNWTGLVGRTGQALPVVLKKHNLNHHNNVHFHLVGNGSMVSELTQALKKAGVPDAYVTIETFFNHKAKADQEAVDEVAQALSAL